jgi:predicted HTH domain antitoxin
MADLLIHYPDEILTSSGKSREELEREMRFKFAAAMYELGEFSLGQAADSLGLSRLTFLDELGRAKIPLINFDDSEIKTELSAIREDHSRR